MSGLVLVDTNVLLYQHDARQQEKQERARAWMAMLWRTRRGRINSQVLSEFYVNATEKLKPGLSRKAARESVATLSAWAPFASDGRTIEVAWEIQDRHQLSWWDALIMASASINTCKYLLTEDLQHDQSVRGVTVVNPFAVSPESL
jgi:predicted nucleic acid-binding protein